MLRNEHLCYRITSPYIKPRFVDPQSPFLLEIASELQLIYTSAAENQMARHELEEITSAIVRSSADVKIASGLNKLLLDRCEFSPPQEVNYPEMRQACLLTAAKMLANSDFSAEKLHLAANGMDIYGDLPELETLHSFENISAGNLLDRYNLAQAQGLLFHASELILTVHESNQSELRKLLKSIKFFRLLTHISSQGKNGLTIKISGPYALFGQTAKYALQLANILPAIVKLAHWEMRAAIRMKNRELTLKLSHKNGLVSHYRQLGGYIPEEIRLFHRQFNDKQQDWQIIGDTPFLDAGNQEIIFPDLSFHSTASGKTFHVELFHRWHAEQLTKRIALLAEKPDLPLLLGIDRSLVKNEDEFDALFADAPEVKEKCWLFRDFPGISSTVNALKRASKRTE